MLNSSLDSLLIRALEEDLGSGDVTTEALIPEEGTSTAVLIAREDLRVAGLPFAERTFSLVDRSLVFGILKKEGSRVKAGTAVAKIRGRTRSILIAERTALNILQRTSGIATLTSRYVEAVKGTGAEIVDTRKTAPGLRFLDKYGVRAGGGRNHRFGLHDGLLIKDNHIAACGGIKAAVSLARTKAPHLLKIEVEVENMAGVRSALKAGADVIMLDNMPPGAMRKAVDYIRNQRPDVLVEASGSVTLEGVREIARTGVDLISVGALTHSVRAADLSLEFMEA
ncbi:MAG: carboxylating nicotinate-nucleotide diphosphorylase [Nitrospiraceae bacterium]|nr:MAG: carboxylating nicotinate-nucleotide diphosphorylase [Nitrospiraceae bacterium]